MDEETMIAVDDLEALDQVEDEERLGDAAPRGPSINPTAC